MAFVVRGRTTFLEGGILLRYGMPDRADGTDHRSSDLAEQLLNSRFPPFPAIQAVYLTRSSPTEFIP